MTGPDDPLPRPRSLEWRDVRDWRKRVRESLISHRLALDGALRESRGKQALQRLLERVELARYPTLGVYWPLRGEIDVRGLATEHLRRGGRVALPVVITKAAPVEFWSWAPGAPMHRDLYGIPVPKEREAVIPDALLVPLVGFDLQRYRLGYGAGYYDRTLAAAARRPFCIGLGYQAGQLDSIFPQPHDIAMDMIVTDSEP
jgi:5-formyltetrahydrofolate cyclo-ligase